MSEPFREHFPVPGPWYWDGRCMLCDQLVTRHKLRWFTIWRKGWWRR